MSHPGDPHLFAHHWGLTPEGRPDAFSLVGYDPMEGIHREWQEAEDARRMQELMRELQGLDEDQ